MAGHRWRGDPSVQGSAKGHRRYVLTELPSPPCACHPACSGGVQIGLTTAAARKALQASLQEDEGEEDEDEQRYLNLNEEEGDVWDEDSAYLELLAKEVCACVTHSLGKASELTI
jgi:hypothetical protein